jgi:hypothetical protein
LICNIECPDVEGDRFERGVADSYDRLPVVVADEAAKASI